MVSVQKFEHMILELRNLIEIMRFHHTRKFRFKIIPIYMRTVYKICILPDAKYKQELNITHITEYLFEFLKKELKLKLITEIECIDIYREIYCSLPFKSDELSLFCESCIKRIEYDIIIAELG